MDFLTLSHTPISRAEMLTRFYAIQENAQKLGKTVPKFLHPHYGTFNWNALWELSALGGIGQLPEFLTTEEDYSIPLPT
ncbi:hypothetical protein H6768_00230 [Candidatus Peribacteria bacterium]|nr:hypothetical protein [Candidatus Peribacteria bacterium]